MSKFFRPLTAWLQNWHISLFEKVILVNSFMLIAETLAALWVTSHQLEMHHYLIDTIFIVIAALFTLFANIFLLRASFHPLFELLKTIRAIGTGHTQQRATVTTASWEISELAQAFNNMLDRLEEVRREQTRTILQAQENERRRIGMELHDEAGQNLTALLIHAEVLNQHFHQLTTSRMAEQSHVQLSTELQQLVHLTRLSLENVRILAQQLRPSVLDDLGLLAAFRWLGEDSGQRLRLQVDLDLQQIEPVVKLLPPNYETALFRITQESLTNIARHAQAETALISLGLKEKNIYLTIQDNGTGYQAEKKMGTGILGMRERATSLGGSLTINALPERGTIVQATLPLPSTIDSRKIMKNNKG
ncbi:histidine kinase [Dictyobacter alpinus]|uniref:histidine kinase n=1 Tax=Dictyobacter alpinus TaxID=2014873 RepID=A0A402AZK4_9CHLR|nr:sensor histidine kinase [Dictyobacter alpinus]GCE24554.1 histidine kinase [Dictyobacter alpinus]